MRSIFFLWRPYSKVPHRVPTGPCVRRFCGRAYETANRLISIRPRCYFCTCRPYVHMWGRSTYQTQPGLRVRAGVPRGAQRTVSRPLSSRLACLGIKLKFQANLWTETWGVSWGLFFFFFAVGKRGDTPSHVRKAPRRNTASNRHGRKGSDGRRGARQKGIDALLVTCGGQIANSSPV